MKTVISLLTGFLLLLPCLHANCEEFNSKNNMPQQKSIQVVCTPELYPLTSTWADEYVRLNPEIKVNLSNVADFAINFVADGKLRFVSELEQKGNKPENMLQIVVGRDVIVPVINSKNPYLNKLEQQGISPEQFVRMFTNSAKQLDWGIIIPEGQKKPIHLYILNEESIIEGVARFLNVATLPAKGITYGNAKEVISAIQKDPYAIGFCNVVSVFGPEKHTLIENVSLLQIDRNANGKIDAVEDIYTDANTFMRGIWIGKYPKSLISNIYAVSENLPDNESELAFLAWVITDGQQFLNSVGYSELVDSEKQSSLDKINPVNINLQAQTNLPSPIGLLAIIFAIILVSGLLLTAIVHAIRQREPVFHKRITNRISAFDENSILVPKGLYFDKTHTWAFMEKDGQVKVGLDDFMQHLVGPITRIVMKNPGERVKKGDVLFYLIQKGKQLMIYAPVTGTIREKNEALLTQSSYLNTSPYSEGWVYRIEPSNWLKDTQLLNMAEQYKKWLSNEFSRVKEFLATMLKPESPEYAHIVLQEGGALKDNVLADFGPKVWEEFQTNFLDK